MTSHGGCSRFIHENIAATKESFRNPMACVTNEGIPRVFVKEDDKWFEVLIGKAV